MRIKDRVNNSEPLIRPNPWEDVAVNGCEVVLVRDSREEIDGAGLGQRRSNGVRKEYDVSVVDLAADRSVGAVLTEIV